MSTHIPSLQRTHAMALRHPQRSGATLPKESLTKEEFFELVRDRLTAVQLDRDSIRKKTQDLARKKGKAYDEIMVSLLPHKTFEAFEVVGRAV